MTDPRIEAAAKAIEAVTYSDVTGALAEECATAALAAADKAAEPVTERLASAVRALRDYREGSPSIPLPHLLDELIAAHKEVTR